jgi:hypothetical protein
VHRGWPGGEGFAVDASLIVADANKQRSTPGPRWNKKLDGAAVSRATKDYLATLDDAAFGAASDKEPRFVSPSDLAAQWTGAQRGPAFFAYSDNYLIDVKNGIIMDVEASRAIRQAEVGAVKTMTPSSASPSSRNGSRATQPMALEPIWTGWSTRPRLHRTSRCSTNRSATMGPSVGRTSRSTRSATFTFARLARSSPRLARWPAMGRHSITGPRHAIAAAARSSHDAVRRRRCAEFRAASTRMLVT